MGFGKAGNGTTVMRKRWGRGRSLVNQEEETVKNLMWKEEAMKSVIFLLSAAILLLSVGPTGGQQFA